MKYVNIQEHIGEKFNKMLVLEIIKGRIVKCQCDCGNIKECDIQDLKRNRIKACGCQRNNPEMRKEAKLRAYKLLENGTLNKGGDHYPKKDREFKYFLKILKSSKGRKDSFLNIDDLKEVWNSQNGICPYSKIKLSLPTHSNYKPDLPYNMASVDRIDSSKPYTKNNIQFVSRTMNYAKNNMTHEQTLEFIKILIKNNKG